MKKCDPFPHFVMDDLRRPKTVLPHPFLYSLSLFLFDLCVVFCIWVLRKLLGFNLNSVFFCFSLLFGWWENNKGGIVLVFYFVYMILLCLTIAGLLQWFEVYYTCRTSPYLCSCLWWKHVLFFSYSSFYNLNSLDWWVTGKGYSSSHHNTLTIASYSCNSCW